MNKPIVHTYVLCWNEEKMIPFFLRHYLKFSDKIFVFDNESSDNSLNELRKSNKVVVETYSSDNQIRDDLYLEIKNDKWKQSRGIADIVIVCDMDEFIYTENVLEMIINFKDSDATIIRPLGIEMCSEYFDFNYDGQIYDIIKDGFNNYKFNKLCMFKPDKITDINFFPGCHEAKAEGYVKYFKESIKLLHFKYIDRNYFLQRVTEYNERLSDFNKISGYGVEYLNDIYVQNNKFNESINNTNKYKIIQ